MDKNQNESIMQLPQNFYTLVANNPQMCTTIDDIRDDENNFRPFQRAEVLYENANSAKQLLAVEVGLQKTLDDVMDLLHRGRIERPVAARYVYTLQSMTLRLGKNNEQTVAREIPYTAQIFQKYQDAISYGETMGINSRLSETQCFSYEFAPDYSFRYLDDKAINNTMIEMKKAQASGDPVRYFRTLIGMRQASNNTGKLSKLVFYGASPKKLEGGAEETVVAEEDGLSQI